MSLSVEGINGFLGLPIKIQSKILLLASLPAAPITKAHRLASKVHREELLMMRTMTEKELNEMCRSIPSFTMSNLQYFGITCLSANTRALMFGKQGEYLQWTSESVYYANNPRFKISTCQLCEEYTDAFEFDEDTKVRMDTKTCLYMMIVRCKQLEIPMSLALKTTKNILKNWITDLTLRGISHLYIYLYSECALRCYPLEKYYQLIFQDAKIETFESEYYETKIPTLKQQSIGFFKFNLVKLR